jgi:hypothetical protein
MDMQNETKSPRLQQTKYTYMVYIGVDKINKLGWKKGDKLVIDLADDGLRITRDKRFVEVPPAIAEVQSPLVPIDSTVIDSAVKDVLKGLV